MAITKTDAAMLSTDMLLRGVIDTIVRESPILNYLPFMEVVGTAVTYNREVTNPAVNFYDPGDTWTEATPTFSPHTAQLTILGGDADVDNFLQQTYSDTNDITAEVIANRAKAMAYAFSNGFYNGNTFTNPKGFDGIDRLIPSGQTISAGTNGAQLTLGMLDELVDKVVGGKPDILAMSKRTRRKLKDLRRADNISIEMGLNEFGQQVEMYDGIPIIVDDFIRTDQTQGTSNSASSVYAIKFGGDGVMGLENGGIQIVNVGDLETKDATRNRLKWYCGLALFNEITTAKLVGVL